MRVGHPTAWTAQEAESRVRGAIASATEDEPWLREHPPGDPRIGVPARRATPCPPTIRSPSVSRTRTSRPTASDRAASPCRARPTRGCYLNDFGVPALCYGPVAHDIHGIDEAVELSARSSTERATLARFIAGWYAEARP